jgi:fructose-specific phosphotransferase system IIC component
VTFEADFLAMTLFLIPILGLALTGWVMVFIILLLLTGFSFSICEVLASLSLRCRQCELS